MNKKTLKASVVITSRNNRDILPRCLDALKNQNIKNFDIFLMDENSTDGTKEFINKNYPHIFFISTPSNVSKRRNIAISKSEAEYIITLDSDAILQKDWIQEAVQYMDNHRDVGVCCGKMFGKTGLIDFAGITIDKTGGVRDIGHKDFDKPKYNTFKRIAGITTASAIIRKSIFQNVGYFDEYYQWGFEDVEFGLRANFGGYKVIYNPELVAIHLCHTTISKMDQKPFIFLLKRNRLLMLLKIFEFNTLLKNSPFISFFLLSDLRKNSILTLKSYSWILFNLSKILDKRKETLKRKKLSDAEIFDRIFFPAFLRFSDKSLFLKKLDKKILKNFTFFITSRCNSRCKHCFYWKHLNKPKDLSLDEISKIFSKFYDVHAVSLGGGEPFMRKDIDDIIKIAVKYTNCKVIDIPTNCLIDITDKLEKILKENPGIRFSIHPSLDGLKEEHDYIRGVKGGFEKTAKLIHKLGKLKEQYSNFETLSVNTVVIDRNYEILPELIKFVKTLPVNGHTFEILRNNPQDELKRPSVSQLKKFGKLMIKTRDYYAKKTPLIKKLFYNRRIKKVWKTQIETLNGKKWGFQCTAGLTDLVIESDGTLRICEFLPKIGNLLKNTPEEILDSEKARIIFEGIKNHECDCTHNCNLTSSIPLRKLF